MSQDNLIHSSAIIEGDISLGRNNHILPYTILLGPLKVGDNNIIGPNVVIGSPGEDTRNPRYDSTQCLIEIGNDNIIREFTVVEKPCHQSATRLGDAIYLMRGVHIPHDALIEDDVVIAPMVTLGGIAKILQGANLGIGCSIHQHSVIGQYSMVAMGASVTKNLKPFAKFIPGKPITVNKYAIEKFSFSKYHDEIYKYVLEGIPPASEDILKIVHHFTLHHQKSNRQLY